MWQSHEKRRRLRDLSSMRVESVRLNKFEEELPVKVTLLNPDQVKNIFNVWGEFAATCYNTPSEYAEKVGNTCFEDGHFSGSRTEYIKFKIEGIDRGIAEQAMRHEIGVRYEQGEHTYDENPAGIVKNLKSFRYVDMDNFEYTIPRSIAGNNEALDWYVGIMGDIDAARSEIKKILIRDGIPKKQAVEDANYILPRATNTSLVIAFTIEAFIHFQHKRQCVRAQHFNQQLARLMKNEVVSIVPKLESKLVPQCEYLLWCPEGNRSCGRFLTRGKLLEKLSFLPLCGEKV